MYTASIGTCVLPGRNDTTVLKLDRTLDRHIFVT